MLAPRDGDAGDRRAAILFQIFGGRAVAAAKIAYADTGSDAGLSGDEAGQIEHGFSGIFTAGFPVAVVHVRSPDRAIKRIQLIVMRRDIVRNGGGRFWLNHGSLDGLGLTVRGASLPDSYRRAPSFFARVFRSAHGARF